MTFQSNLFVNFRYNKYIYYEKISNVLKSSFSYANIIRKEKPIAYGAAII